MRCRFVTAAALLILTSVAVADDWPQWRGPNHDGMSPDKGFRTRWENPPPKLWERAIGSAFSGISIVGDRVYTCGTANNQQTLLCLNANTGEVVWRKGFDEAYPDGQGGDGTRATPTVNDGRVYIQSPRGRVVCCDAKTGEEIWNRPFDTKPQWGYSASVLIEGDLALVTGDNALTALNKTTGEIVWNCEIGPVGYSTPYPFTFEGNRYVVAFMAKVVAIVEPKTGREVARTSWETDWDVNAATPIYHDGYLFISSGYKHGAAVYKLAGAGDKLSLTPVWDNKSIMAKFQTPVLYEGYLYTSDQKELKCVEFMTGAVKWSKKRIRHGTVVVADGQLLVLTEDGRLLIGKASPTGFEPTTDVAVLDGKCWTVPTLANGKLYVRNLEKVACYDLKAK